MTETVESCEITTEHARGKEAMRAVRMILLFWSIGGVVAIVSVWLYSPTNTSVDERAGMTALLAGMTALIVIGFLLAQFQIKRGTWIVESCGITFMPLNGESSFLNWDDVEAVQWQREQASFRAGKMMMRLPWNRCDVDASAEARRFIEERLGQTFDLGNRKPPTIQLGVWSVAKWLTKIVLVSIVLTGISMSGLFAAALWAPLSDFAWMGGMLMIFSPWLLLIPAIRRERRLYPAWRMKLAAPPT